MYFHLYEFLVFLRQNIDFAISDKWGTNARQNPRMEFDEISTRSLSRDAIVYIQSEWLLKFTVITRMDMMTLNKGKQPHQDKKKCHFYDTHVSSKYDEETLLPKDRMQLPKKITYTGIAK